MRAADDAGRFDRQAERRIGEVVRYVDDDTVVELRLLGDDGVVERAPRLVRVAAEVDANDYPKGTRYEVLADPNGDRATARLVAEPYDATEPIAWSCLVLLAGAGWLVRRPAGRS